VSSRAWEIVQLGDHCSKIGSGSTPRGGESVYQDEGVSFVRSQNVYNGQFTSDGLAHLSDEQADQLAGVTVESGDVLLNITGDSVARSCRVPDDVLPARVNQHVAIIRPRSEDFDSRFLAYFLISPFMQDLMLSLAGSGGTRKALTKAMIERLRVPRPPRSVQARIADILSAYDDLIENNRRRMALLEEAARQLYREWFDNLRFPGHEHTHITAGVPEGWEKRTFADACASLEDGDWIESKDQGGEDYRLLQISNIGVNEFVETGKFRCVSEETFKRLNCRELSPGNILIARMPKPIGRAWLITEMPWRMITAVDAAIAVADEELADPYFLTYYLNSRASLERCERRAVGATRPRIARRELAALPLLLPPRRLQMHFREWVEPVNRQRTTLFRQNERLRAARDLLLPRLMSGEIAV
jgi:type I restriction enzyme S subunit